MEKTITINYNNNDNKRIQYSSIKELEDKTQENTILLKNENTENTEKEEFRSTSANSQIELITEKKLPLIYGNNKVLMYMNDEPFIVIGPHCKN